MSILIVGAEGAQGKRYRAILKFLSISYTCSDASYPSPPIVRDDLEGILIATPTDTHTTVIRQHLKYKKPILCEKPISKDVYDVQHIFEQCEKENVPLSMVMQYRQLLPLSLKSRDRSYYDYFRHGNDGLVWDCLQIIGLSRGEVSLSETSPIWKCEINGYNLRIEDMDKAYISEVKDWTRKISHETPEQIIQIHQKVDAYSKKP